MVSPDLACSRPISPRYELLCEIRKVRNSVSVIMISAYESIDLVERCILSGADAYLLKPLRMHELRNIWQYVWRRRHELQLVQQVSSLHASGRHGAPLASCHWWAASAPRSPAAPKYIKTVKQHPPLLTLDLSSLVCNAIPDQVLTEAAIEP